MLHLCHLMGVQQLFAIIYHPQTDMLIEYMNQTITELLCRTVGAAPSQLDQFLDPFLFVLRETLQISLGTARLNLYIGTAPINSLRC